MAEQTQPPAPPPDPLTMWREYAAKMEDQWNQFFNQAMGSEAFAQSMGRSMETALMMQQRLAQQFESTLKAWNLPTRSDITALGERLAAIEERLEELAEKLEERPSRPRRGGD